MDMSDEEEILQVAEITACFKDFNREDDALVLYQQDIDSNKSGFYIINHLMKVLRNIVKNSTRFENSIYYQNNN
jgi:hypothetical protein